jgi:hypothetical protein
VSTPQDGPVHESAPEPHQCPPDRVAMMARLSEIQASYDTRLANQRQVIENLSDARKEALDDVRELKTFVQGLVEKNLLPQHEREMAEALTEGQ